ncbi:hypothetical protein [Flavobacterium sp. W21_SRS_FM6]|uniref:hypothetical protein n=1 Tax=Flavobacterium sp. W21_SRS_FM6 TaxID=3240268 RepID=UPI003F8EF9A1
MDDIINDPEKLCELSNPPIMKKGVTEAIKVITWLVMPGALGPNVNSRHKHYHAPLSHTGCERAITRGYS